MIFNNINTTAVHSHIETTNHKNGYVLNTIQIDLSTFGWVLYIPIICYITGSMSLHNIQQTMLRY